MFPCGMTADRHFACARSLCALTAAAAPFAPASYAHQPFFRAWE